MAFSQKTRRKFWLKIHLYLGLIAGAVFVLIGLTGSLLVFEQTLDELLNPELMTVSAPDPLTDFLPLEDIVSAGEKVLPANGKLQSIGFPRHSGSAFDLWYSQPAPNSEYSESHQIFVNPYTAEVTGQRLKVDFPRGWRGPFMDIVLRLHYSLALGDYGMSSVGFIGLAVLFLLLTGLIVWWPSPGKLKNALTVKRKASLARFIFDLHKIFGFYSAVILLFLTLSGIYLIFPDYGRGLISVFSPVAEPYPVYRSTVPKEDKKPISLVEVKAIADVRFPAGEYRFIGFPRDESGVFLVAKRAKDEPNVRGAYRRLWIDQYSGKILNVRDQNAQSAGDSFVEWLFPLHTGEAFGLCGQLIVLLSGLIPLILYATGVIRWIQKHNTVRESFSRYERCRMK